MQSALAITDELVVEWLVRNGLNHQRIERLPDIGFVNDVFAIGHELILRVNKPHVEENDAFTESVAVPVAVAAGIATPPLLHFDTSRSVFPTVASLYERAPGTTLVRLRVDQAELPGLYRALGREIGLLHKTVSDCPDPNGWLDTAEVADARAELARARSAMKVEAVSFDWLSGWLDRLEPALEAPLTKVFLHNDLHSANTMVHTGPLRLSAVIDWGDAAWGDPMLDFETMPIWAVEWMLEGYEPLMGPVDELFLGRLLWHDIACALDATTDPWVETMEPWQPLTTSRWINLIRFLTEVRDPRWRRWLPQDGL